MLSQLVVMRHAAACYNHKDSDHSRPLTTAGEQDALHRGRQLAQVAGPFDRVLVSTAQRTRQTVRLVQPEGAEAVFLDDIYAASAGQLLALMEAHGQGCTLLIGHNPGLSNLVSIISGTDQGLRPADAVVLQFEPDASFPIQPGSGRIIATVTGG